MPTQLFIRYLHGAMTYGLLHGMYWTHQTELRSSALYSVRAVKIMGAALMTPMLMPLVLANDVIELECRLRHMPELSPNCSPIVHGCRNC